ncbi:hypothetical protein EST38_g11684 [Candolleomyces aberdarensis]|uniref:Uncharacterized protein n=1 Tax=Candolleomyces aberdarensis TaxID=2316362 RepID=A0A4Q2D4A6_9AGAR|nr:hypothetical protein EST38_g11684 [Candolleomyces aberdarensis]
MLFIRHALKFPPQKRRKDPAILQALDNLPEGLREMVENVILGDWDDGLFQSKEDYFKVFQDIVDWFN